MKQITLKVKDSYYDLFVQFLQHLPFVEIVAREDISDKNFEKNEPLTKAEIWVNFSKSIRDANAALGGDIQIYNALEKMEIEQALH